MRDSELRHKPLVLVVEDGDEYHETLTNFVGEDFRYVQAHHGAEAVEKATLECPDLIFLDMRFDRIDVSCLLGDLAALSSRFNGDASRARRFQIDNQGLYVLAHLRAAGFDQPAVVSYDFSAEPQRLAALRSQHGSVHYCPDYASAANMAAAIAAALGRKA